MNQCFTLQMHPEIDGSVSWKLEKARVVDGILPAVLLPVRIQGHGIETFILPHSQDARYFFDAKLHARGVDGESRAMILEGVV
jgi:hypothetical protein